ncbi:aspartyl/glutamyl-tRNA amidotransferase subunit B [Linderina pennispora]|uniref:Glutamyl-tRNA(Gln) amidotransferase subunit B, mitochondrial n=1 Tax=Linderina pennispora TaxID=61395 RepID=A0A1Y1W5T7_9FUNG|nr:aspartyl/glutamyl-tRNA amidotransferase subunit B [Linderina pennispora]ORX68725.1 aspartyl/glutamyl-tRNA amidotransferase subunit B [Linderina pennispora]
MLSVLRIRNISAPNSACSALRRAYTTPAPKWNTTIGLELHVQLSAKQKLFSPASAKWDDPANSNIDLPGRFLALDGTVQPTSAFDRKHYFYADQPLGYQITQSARPIGRGGQIELGSADGLSYTRRVRIHQLQLEQDTAKSIHNVYPGYVLSDLNRAGVALVEIVSEADMCTADEAAHYVRRMQTLLRHIGVSNCNMEEGSLRCDVNVSVFRDGDDPLSGTRCELKNLNSLKVIRGAIEAESARQIAVIESGQTVGQETRGYDARTNTTFLQRSKETAPDYRYMPEPDIPPVRVTEAWVDAVRNAMPELPDRLLARVTEHYGLLRDEVETMMGEPGCIALFEAVMATGKHDAKRVASWITSEIFGQLAYRNQKLADSQLTPQLLDDILDALANSQVTSAQAKQLLIELMDGDKRKVGELIEAHGWRVMDDQSELRNIIAVLLEKHPNEIADYRAGNKRRMNFFVGKVMGATKGQAKPQDFLDSKPE